MADVRFFSIVRKDTSARISVPGPLGYMIQFDYQAEHPMMAQLIVEEARRRHQGMVEELARDMYNQGWKDAKAKKKAKRDWFQSWLKTER